MPAAQKHTPKPMVCFPLQHSGLAATGSSIEFPNSAPVGPLSRHQVQLAELLAKLHISKRR